MTPPAKGRARVRVVRLRHGLGLPLPAYHSKGAAGLDLVAALDAQRPLMLAPGTRALVPTGLIIELPPGYEAQVRPRSGLALNYGIAVLNSPGTIDSDYRGEVGVVLANLGHAPFEVRRGERIAQLVVLPVVQAELVEVTEVSETARRDGGFGSTGKVVAPSQPVPAKRAAKRKSAAGKGAAGKPRPRTKGKRR